MDQEKYIDLHFHSNSSDGTLAPKELVNLAYENNVGMLAIADHDSISGLDEFKCNIQKGMLGVKGIEFSSYLTINNDYQRLHMLGYCFDENNNAFKSLVNEMQEKRIIAHKKFLQELKEKIKKFPYEEIKNLNITKYCWFDREIVNYLIKITYPEEIIEELKRYCKIKRFNYGNAYNLDVQKVIDAIHSAGGYAIFAHPMAYSFSNDYDEVNKVISKLISMGIDGIEIYQSDCSQKDTNWLKKIVEVNNLLYSVGSDFHKIESSDGRQIGLGIDHSLCVTETSLSNEIKRTRKYF